MNSCRQIRAALQLCLLSRKTPAILPAVVTKRWKTYTRESYSRFPVPERESLPDDIKTTFKEVEEKAGFVPNVFNTLSYRPEELRMFMQYHDIVMAERGNLTKADKEMIVVATSAENKCLYCIVAHGAILRIYAKDPYLADQLAGNWRTADITERQMAILEFAVEVCHCRPLTEETFEKLYKHGFTEDDAWDIGAVASLFALSNRMAFLTNMKPNQEFYLMVGRDYCKSVNDYLLLKALVQHQDAEHDKRLVPGKLFTP